MPNYRFPVNIRDYGADWTGVADSSPALELALDALGTSGGLLVYPPGEYSFLSQPIIPAPQNGRLEIVGYGATIRTTGAISALRITGGSTTGGATVRGFHVDHRNNALATAGLEAVGTWFATFDDCTVAADDVGSTYAGFLVRSTTPSDIDTGSYWTTIKGCTVSRRGSTQGANMPYGVRFLGTANAALVDDCRIMYATVGVSFEPESGQTGIPDTPVISNTKFEHFGTGVVMSGAANSVMNGHRFHSNRFEDGTTAFSMIGMSGPQFGEGPTAWGNFLESGIAYLNNPNGLPFYSLDHAQTPEFWDMVAAL